MFLNYNTCCFVIDIMGVLTKAFVLIFRPNNLIYLPFLSCCDKSQIPEKVSFHRPLMPSSYFTNIKGQNLKKSLERKNASKSWNKLSKNARYPSQFCNTAKARLSWVHINCLKLFQKVFFYFLFNLNWDERFQKIYQPRSG